MKRALKIFSVCMIIISMAFSVNAISGAGSFLAGYDYEVTNKNMSAGTHYYELALRSVSYSGIPANTFPSGARVTMAYTGGGLRYVQRHFTTLTKYSGSYGLNQGQNIVYHIDNVSGLDCYMGYSYNFG